MSRRANAALCAMVLLPTVALVGCATKIRNIPNLALARQSTTVVERDQHECERGITGKVKGVWFPAELEFAACMVARNYQVYVQVLDASLEVKKASLPRRMTTLHVLADLTTCERLVERNVTVAEMIGRPAVVIAGVFFWPVSVGSMMASAKLAVNRQLDYKLCMEPRGYVVTPWEPGVGDHPPTRPAEERPAL